MQQGQVGRVIYVGVDTHRAVTSPASSTPAVQRSPTPPFRRTGKAAPVERPVGLFDPGASGQHGFVLATGKDTEELVQYREVADDLWWSRAHATSSSHPSAFGRNMAHSKVGSHLKSKTVPLSGVNDPSQLRHHYTCTPLRS